MSLNNIFAGLKVIELANVLAGPSVGAFFSELGATVIKIENRLTSGDVTRKWKLPGESADSDISSYFSSVNWGKLSIGVHLRDNPISLFKEKNEIEIEFHSELKDPFSLIMSGSAGGGVQLATELFAQAAIASGLEVSKKGNYPVTVGTGFSSTEIIVSPDPILFTGVKDPDVVIIVSKDGLEHCRAVIERMKNGLLIIDENIDAPITGAEVLKHDFHGIAGARSAALYALFFYLHRNPVIPVDALVSALGRSGISDKVDLDMLLNFEIE